MTTAMREDCTVPHDYVFYLTSIRFLAEHGNYAAYVRYRLPVWNVGVLRSKPETNPSVF